MELTSKQTRFLRAQAHALSPLVQVGKGGLSEAVVRDIVLKLADHELIKVKIVCDDAQEMKELARQAADAAEAALVQVIGHTAVLYRPSEKRKIQLP